MSIYHGIYYTLDLPLHGRIVGETSFIWFQTTGCVGMSPKLVLFYEIHQHIYPLSIIAWSGLYCFSHYQPTGCHWTRNQLLYYTWSVKVVPMIIRRDASHAIILTTVMMIDMVRCGNVRSKMLLRIYFKDLPCIGGVNVSMLQTRSSNLIFHGVSLIPGHRRYNM